MEKREVVERRGSEMALVDMHRNVFLTPRYQAAILVTELQPVTICKPVGWFDSFEEAAEAAREALLANAQGGGQ